MPPSNDPANEPFLPESSITTPEQTPLLAAPKTPSPYLIPGSIVLGSTIIGLFLMAGLSLQKGSPSVTAGVQQAAAAAVDIKDVKTDGDPYIGNANAPVTMAYWSDYQCPFCKAFEVGGVPQINSTTPPAMPDIIKKYVAAGKLKVVFKDFPFLGNDSMTGAEYEHAVWELYPQQFYNWRVAMYKAQDEEGDQGFGNADSIDQLIAQQFPQFDVAKIRQLVASKKAQYDAAIDADKTEGSTFGVNGTPGFIIGTTLIPGAAPLAQFTAAIDAQLK